MEFNFEGFLDSRSFCFENLNLFLEVREFFNREVVWKGLLEFKFRGFFDSNFFCYEYLNFVLGFENLGIIIKV